MQMVKWKAKTEVCMHGGVPQSRQGDTQGKRLMKLWGRGWYSSPARRRHRGLAYVVGTVSLQH